MQNILGWLGLGSALVMGQMAAAQSLSCKFIDDRGYAIEITLTAEAPWFPALQAPHKGSIAFAIEGLPFAVLPATVNPNDRQSKFDVVDGQLKSANVIFNQGHQKVQIYFNGADKVIRLELPYGMLGGIGTITRVCL